MESSPAWERQPARHGARQTAAIDITWIECARPEPSGHLWDITDGNARRPEPPDLVDRWPIGIAKDGASAVVGWRGWGTEVVCRPSQLCRVLQNVSEASPGVEVVHHRDQVEHIASLPAGEAVSRDGSVGSDADGTAWSTVVVPRAANQESAGLLSGTVVEAQASAHLPRIHEHPTQVGRLVGRSSRFADHVTLTAALEADGLPEGTSPGM